MKALREHLSLALWHNRADIKGTFANGMLPVNVAKVVEDSVQAFDLEHPMVKEFRAIDLEVSATLVCKFSPKRRFVLVGRGVVAMLKCRALLIWPIMKAGVSSMPFEVYPALAEDLKAAMAEHMSSSEADSYLEKLRQETNAPGKYIGLLKLPLREVLGIIHSDIEAFCEDYKSEEAYTKQRQQI